MHTIVLLTPGFVTTELPASDGGSKVSPNISAYSKTEKHAHDFDRPVPLFADRKPLVDFLAPEESANDSYCRTNGKPDAKRTLVVGDSEHPVDHERCDWNAQPDDVPQTTIKHIPNAPED